MANRLKYIFLTVICLVAVGFQATAQETPDIAADSAYTAGDYKLATELYRQTIDSVGTSAALYYNLGNSLYREGKLSQAILAYERSLRLDPANSNTRQNLEFVNSKLIDKKGFEGSFLSRTFNDMTNMMSSNAWAWLALILFAATIGAVALYMFSSGVMLRKAGFFGGGITLILCVISVIFSINGARLANADDVAIVTAPSTILSTSPRAPQNRNEEAMLLHEGARVTILDSITAPIDSVKSTWYDVQFDNDHRAWINSKDVEII